MRNVLSLLCLVMASLLAVGALGGSQLDQLLRSEEPIREIAGGLPQQDEFPEAVSEVIVDDLTARMPADIQSFVPGGVDQLLSPLVFEALDNERTMTAWDQVLQETRSGYAVQLESLFETGTTGSTRELDIDVDLTPVSEAITEPLREGLYSALSWVPGLELDSFDVLAPDVEIDIEAVTDDSADPYAWATLAVASQHWLLFGIGSAVLAVLGLLLGTSRFRWYALAGGGLIAAAIGLWIATTVAAPALEQPVGTPALTAVILDHVQSHYTAWAQPPWWIFTAAAAATMVIGGLAGALTPARRRS